MSRVLIIAAVFLLSCHSAIAQVVTDMTPERIREAIADQKADGCYELKGGYACFTTPYARVVAASRTAREKYETLSEKDVTPAMVAPVVEVIAVPQPSFVYGRGRTGPPIDVEAVVVMPKGGKDRSVAILPMETGPLDRQYQNLMGAKWEARGLVARFPLSVLSESNEVRIVYDGKGCADWKNKLTEECSIALKLKGVK